MTLRLFLTCASVIALASTQVIPGCTTDSFAIPSWWINGLKISEDTATFQIIARQNNQTVNVVCPTRRDGATCPSTKGQPLEVSVSSPEGEKAQVSINHTWTCSDRSNLTFSATGVETLPLKCAGANCEAVNPQHLIKGSLHQPVEITPQYSAGPPGHDTQGCASLAMKPTWDVSRVSFVEPTGDGLDTAELRTFSMLILNPQTGYIASCFSGDFGGGRGATETGLVCAGVEFNDLSAERYRINTTAAFDAANFQLKITQDWFCDDVNPAQPVQVSASATQILNLTCTDRPLEGIPNGNERTCESDDNILITGKLDTTTPLPPYSLTDPVPVADGCTITSILNPRWTFSNFRVYDTVVSFNVILQAARRGYASPMGITQNQKIPGLDNFRVCEIDEADSNVSPLWPSWCIFRYTEAKQTFELSANWTCSDLDVNHPVEFSGFTTTTIKTPTCEKDEDGRFDCLTEGPWTESISGVKWRPAPK